MKNAKNFTDGLAVFLAILIAIYFITGYAKYKPDEAKLEAGQSKLELYLNTSIEHRQYLHLLIFLTISAAAGYALRRRPCWGVLTACVTLAYALTLYDNKQLSEHPMFILCFLLCHAVGAVVFAATEDRRLHGNAAFSGQLLCSGAALAVSTVCSVFQSHAAETAEMAAELTEQNILLQPKLGVFPDLVRMIWLHNKNAGSMSARDIATKLARSIKADGLVQYFYNSVDPEHLKTYIRLCLLIFASAVLCLVLRRRLLSPVVASVPLVYALAVMQTERLSCLPMMVLVFTGFSAVCAFADYEQAGLPPVSVIEREENEAEAAQAAAAGTSPDAELGDVPAPQTAAEADDEEGEVYYR